MSKVIESSVLDQRHIMSGKYCTYQDITGIYSDYDDCGYYIGDTGKFYDSPGKKVKNIYHLLYSNKNLCKAQYNAQKGKGDRTEIRISMRICWRIWMISTGCSGMKLIHLESTGLR